MSRLLNRTALQLRITVSANLFRKTALKELTGTSQSCNACASNLVLATSIITLARALAIVNAKNTSLVPTWVVIRCTGARSTACANVSRNQTAVRTLKIASVIGTPKPVLVNVTKKSQTFAKTRLQALPCTSVSKLAHANPSLSHVSRTNSGIIASTNAFVFTKPALVDSSLTTRSALAHAWIRSALRTIIMTTIFADAFVSSHQVFVRPGVQRTTSMHIGARNSVSVSAFSILKGVLRMSFGILKLARALAFLKIAQTTI